MNWLLNAHVLAIALLVLIGPGLVLARLCRVRGLALWASAAPLSVSFIACTAIVLGLLGIRFTPLNVSIVLSMAAATTWILAKRLSVTGSFFWAKALPPRQFGYVAYCLGLAALIIGWRLISIFGQPDAFSQTFDDVFHLNAIRYILQSGSGSALTIGLMVNPEQTISFYPSAWHDLAALVALATGSGIPVATNAVNIVICAFVWPSSILFMVTRITGLKLIPVMLTAILSAGFTAFPYLLLDFGVLYPYMLAVALLPLGIGLAITFTQTDTPFSRKNIGAAVLLACSLPGMLLAHPSIILGLIAFTAPVAILLFIRAVKNWIPWRSGFAKIIIPIVLISIYFAVATVVWNFLRPDPDAAFWVPIQSLSQAIGEGLLSAPMFNPIPWVIAIMTLCGIAWLIRNRSLWWVLGIFAIGLALFSVVSGFPPGWIRSFITGGWYNDSNRLAALLPISVISVAVIGGSWLINLVVEIGRNWTISSRFIPLSRRWVRVIAIVGSLFLATITQLGSVSHEVRSAAGQFRITDESPLISSDEMALLDRIDEVVPAGATIVASPWTGASLVYALADRLSLTPHMFGDPDNDAEYILNNLSNLMTDPAVCEAIEKKRTFYILDFGDREVHGGHHPFPGVNGLSDMDGISLIDHEGEARLYKVTGCR